MVLKRLRQLGATLLGLEIAYLVLGNLFLAFGLRPLASWSPETVLMEYESAYTLWPGGAHVRRFRLRNQSRALQWQLEVEDASVTVDLFALFRRTFHASRIRAEGVSFRLRRRLDDDGAASPRRAALPPIEGYADPPLLPIGPDEPPSTETKHWSASLEDTSASVREIWVDEWRLVGSAGVTGRFFYEPERVLQLGPTTLDVRSAELRVGETVALTDLDAHLTSTVGAVDLGGPIARNVRQISGRGTVDARVASTEFVQLYLNGVPGFRVLDGSGTLAATVRLEHGRAVPGTSVAVTCDRLVLQTPEAEATLAFSADAHVEAAGAGPNATGELRIDRGTLVLVSREREPPVVEDARAHFHGLPRDLAGPLEMTGPTELDVPVRFPDLGWRSPPPTTAGHATSP